MPFINVTNTSNPQGSVTTSPPNFRGDEVNTQASQSQSNAQVVQDDDQSTPVASAPVTATTTVQNTNDFQLPSVTIETQLHDDGVKVVRANLPAVENAAPAPKFNNDLSAKFEEKLSNIQDLDKLVSQSDMPVPQVPDNTMPQTQDISALTPKVDMIPNNLRYSSFDLFDLLKYAIDHKASDIHLTVGYRAMVRIDGDLQVVNSPILNTSQINQCVLELIKSRHELNINSIYEADLTYTYENRRFRVNIFKQMSNFSIAMRIIPDKIVTIEELGLPPVVKSFSKIANGLVLVTGPTGSGKSTTIASLLNLINLAEPKHIVTLEDPVEFVFPKGMSFIDQREFGIDYTSWANALRSVLRQDPDVVLVGEMRDLETIESALQIAETGHLVFATLHTNGAAETINRVIDVFDSQKQDQIRIQLSSVLKAVISQKLLAITGGGRKAAVEILISNASIKNAIRDKKTFQIDNMIQTGSDVGMVSLEKSLISFVREGSISLDYAKTISSKPNELDILMKS